MEYVWHSEVSAASDVGSGSVILSSFPSAGFATTVAGHYMTRVLKWPRIGRFESNDNAPIAVIQGGEVSPTIRVYGRPSLALVLSEFPPTPNQANALARTIVAAAEQRKARLIIGLEGVVPHPENEGEDGGTPTEPADEQVWVAFSRKDSPTVELFDGAKVRPLEDGIIGGVSGAMLVRAIGGSVPVAVMLVSARAAGGLPDNRAGAAMIEALDRLLPELRVDTGPLRAQAEEIEKALRAALKKRPAPPGPDAPDAGSTPPPSPEMYG